MFFGGNRMNQNVDNNKYYKILGVDKNANEKDIKKAYRRLAVVHHPDKGGDSTKLNRTKDFFTSYFKKIQYSHNFTYSQSIYESTI